MRRVRDTVSFIVSWTLIAGLLVAGWVFRYQINDAVRILAGEYLPCTVPIRYSLGQFDERFDISQQEFMAVVEESAEAWSKAVGKPLFQKAENGELEINLIYDYRQQATDQLESLGIGIESEKGQYNELKAEYERRKQVIGQEQAQLESAVSRFEAQRDAYQKQVQEWNEKGGAPPGVYQRLNQEKAALDRLQAEIKQATDSLNQKIDDLNAVVTVLNGAAARLNLEAETYRQTATARGEKFQEGEYVRDGSGTRINIYEFSDETMLRRVMMHELGHAIGLEHIEDTESIMYELNQAPEAVLTESDKQTIQRQCKLNLPW